MTLREKLIVLRDKAGISQMALAHQLDVSRQAVSRWESGDATPSIDKLKALAKVYGVSLDWLCSDADELDGENKQVPEIREATENNEDAQSGAVQDRRKKKKLGIAAAIVILGYCYLDVCFIGKDKLQNRWKICQTRQLHQKKAKIQNLLISDGKVEEKLRLWSIKVNAYALFW